MAKNKTWLPEISTQNQIETIIPVRYYFLTGIINLKIWNIDSVVHAKRFFFR